MDFFQEDIIELRNFKQLHNLKDMNVYCYSDNMNNMPYFIYSVSAMEKLIRGVNLLSMLFLGDCIHGLYPLITTNSLYLIELENEGSDCINKIEYYSKRIAGIKNKLSSKNFAEKAPADIVNLERKRLADFENILNWACIGYTFV